MKKIVFFFYVLLCNILFILFYTYIFHFLRVFVYKVKEPGELRILNGHAIMEFKSLAFRLGNFICVI